MHQSFAVGFTINLATCAVGSFSHCELDLRLPCTGTDWFAIQALIGACIQVIRSFPVNHCADIIKYTTKNDACQIYFSHHEV